MVEKFASWVASILSAVFIAVHTDSALVGLSVYFGFVAIGSMISQRK